jgi:anti-anti-sigma factor
MMYATASYVDFSREGDTLIVTLVADPTEAHYDQFEEEANEAANRLSDPTIKNVVLDFGMTDYVGSSALKFFGRLWEKVQAHHGRMAICHASEGEREVLHGTHLDGLWPICHSRQEAREAVAG